MSGRFVAFVMIAGLLAGCGGSVGDRPHTGPVSSVPTADPTTSVTHSAPPSPARPTIPADVPRTGPNLKYKGEQPPVMPVAATQHTQAGAVAFAEFFIKTMDWGFATTNATYMRHYYTPGCLECASHADSLDATRRAGHHYLGGRFEITGAQRRAQGDEVVVFFNLSSVEVVDANNAFVNGGVAQRGLAEDIRLTWRTGGGWVVSKMAPQ